jgi:acetylornithine/succinyldiaminopimelate/putrescine aminotransferase
MYDDRLDTWAPGAHTGTFRGNQLAFAAGAEAVRIIRRDDVLGNVQRRPRTSTHASTRCATSPGYATSEASA